GPDDRIIDAIKHIDFTMSAKRQILPKLPYIMPPAQDKIDLLLHPPVEALQRVLAQKKPLEKALLAAVQGISPLVCRELCVQVSCDGMTSAAEIDDVSKGRLLATLTALCHNIQSYSGEPYLLSDSQTNLPLEFSFMPITQYGSKVQSQKMASFSELLDMFYGERDRVLRVHQRAHDILQVVNRTTERISRKINKQRVELSESENRDTLKECGDILSANLYQLKRGMDSCILENFYHNNEPKKIALDVRMTPAQNAQKYYKEYHKAATAQNYLTEQISSGEEELIYLETVLDEVTRASGESDIMEIREELQDGGYLRKRGQKSVKKRVHKPRRFLSDDGFEIFVGRNNKQNDRLTLKTAAKTDVWFHTKDIPGAHVIVFADGQEVPERTLTQAAILAATNSKAGESAQVSVDYVQARYVKKPTGAKPGKVIYDHYHTAYVRPDKELEERLEKQAAQSHSQS
ncbi:MAG TPA: hypothetical protein DEP42_03130, partial [Ruminococcaceae bacterium]|nr:hypothetical protein [Oscillospiraceae bacterium]